MASVAGVDSAAFSPFPADSHAREHHQRLPERSVEELSCRRTAMVLHWIVPSSSIALTKGELIDPAVERKGLVVVPGFG